jgi:hypothetical protein
LIASVAVSLQPPAHASMSLGHTHTLFEHAPAPQSQPQPPQFLGSARPSMQTPPHITWPGVGQPLPVVMNGAAPPALSPLPSEPVDGSPLQAAHAKSTSPRMEIRLNQHLFARIVQQVTRSN